jgi:hypothetical protein
MNKGVLDSVVKSIRIVDLQRKLQSKNALALQAAKKITFSAIFPHEELEIRLVERVL